MNNNKINSFFIVLAITCLGITNTNNLKASCLNGGLEYCHIYYTDVGEGEQEVSLECEEAWPGPLPDTSVRCSAEITQD